MTSDWTSVFAEGSVRRHLTLAIFHNYRKDARTILLICDVIVRHESCRKPRLQTGSLVTDTWAPAMVWNVMVTCASDFCVPNSLITLLSGFSFLVGFLSSMSAFWPNTPLRHSRSCSKRRCSLAETRKHRAGYHQHSYAL